MQDSIKLTGKNQLTVPAKVARQLGLERGDFLQYAVKDQMLVLKLRPSVGQRLKDVWADNATANKGAASDDSIKKTLRSYHTKQKSRP